jgi:Leu/Phe-tRNA-protein transferase
MNKTVKIKMCKMLMTSVVVSSCETCAMTEMDMKRLMTWVRKMLRVIYVSMVEQGI